MLAFFFAFRLHFYLLAARLIYHLFHGLLRHPAACVGILVFIEKETEIRRIRPPSLRPDGQFQSVLDDKASIIFPVGHSSHISLGVRKDENSTCT